MIKVYGAPPSRSQRVIWMLEEMGLDYQVAAVDFARRRDDAAFLEASPAAALPAIEDGEVKMMESIAILEYLAARHGPTPLAPAASDPRFPLYQQFLHFGEASLAAPLNVAIATRFFAPEDEKQNWGARIAVQMGVQKAQVLEGRLQTAAFLAGDGFTAADISCAYALQLLSVLGAAEALGPATRDYLARVQARPAHQRAMRHATPIMGRPSQGGGSE